MPDDKLQRWTAYASCRKFQMDRLLPWLIAGMGWMLVVPSTLEALERLSGLAFGKAIAAAGLWLGAGILLLGLVRIARLPRLV